MKNFKRKAVVSLANLAILGGGFAGSVGVFADSLDTPVRVQFNAENHIPNPDPDPDALQLRFVPGAVNFGTVEATGSAVTSQQTVGRYVALYDGRDASETDWKLSAKSSVLTNAADTTRTINTGNIRIGTGAVANWTNLNEPTATNVTGTPTGITDLTTGGNVTLPLDGTTTVGIAQTNASGTDAGYAVPINDMELTVTGAATESGQSYTGTVSWILEDTI